jgi:hypothetical protein
MKTLLASLSVLLVAPAFAAAGASFDSSVSAGLQALTARAKAVSAVAARDAQVRRAPAGQAAPSSCDTARPLERSYVLTLPGAAPVVLRYQGCADYGRNDYLAGYTERTFQGGGYSLVMETGHDDGAYPSAGPDFTSLYLTQGKTGVARAEGVSNGVMMSGRSVAVGNASLRAAEAAPDTCIPATTLERSYQLTVNGSAPVILEYRGCVEYGAVFHMPGRTERVFEGGGYRLLMTTDHGDGAVLSLGPALTEAYLTKGDSSVANFGAVRNDELVSGKPVTANGATLRALK